VLGKADVTPLDHNRGAYYPTAGAMNMPYGLYVQDDRLIVADTANSRLLGFDLDEVRMDASASRVAGQRLRAEGRQSVRPGGSRQPALALWRCRLRFYGHDR